MISVKGRKERNSTGGVFLLSLSINAKRADKCKSVSLRRESRSEGEDGQFAYGK